MYQQQRPVFMENSNSQQRASQQQMNNTQLGMNGYQQQQQSQQGQQSQQLNQQHFPSFGQIPPQGAQAQLLSGVLPQQQSQQPQQQGPPGIQNPPNLQPHPSAIQGPRALDDEKVYKWIVELSYGPNREEALLELGKQREQYEDLPLVLWNSFGVMTSLLDEIISVYPLLSPPNLSSSASNRVCNALALLQCVAAHPETRTFFLNANIPLFLYPFLNTNSKQRTFEYLRLTSLGVIGALVKNDTPEVISFLLTTEIIPLCLRIMESSAELSKTVAIFIVQKILTDDNGLSYVCQTYERFAAVASVLKTMVEHLVTNQASRLLKHVVRCYLRLSDNVDARKALVACLPESLKDGTFVAVLKEDQATKKCLTQLLFNLGDYETQQQQISQLQQKQQQQQPNANQLNPLLAQQFSMKQNL